MILRPGWRRLQTLLLPFFVKLMGINLHRFQPLLQREQPRSLAHEHHMLGLFHDPPRRGNRMPNTLERSHTPSAMPGPVHDARIELNHTRRIWPAAQTNRMLPLIVSLRDPNPLLYRIQSRAACKKNLQGFVIGRFAKRPRGDNQRHFAGSHIRFGLAIFGSRQHIDAQKTRRRPAYKFAPGHVHSMSRLSPATPAGRAIITRRHSRFEKNRAALSAESTTPAACCVGLHVHAALELCASLTKTGPRTSGHRLHLPSKAP